MSLGYVYCISNPRMPGIVKIGYTDRSPAERLEEANTSTWNFPEFKLEFARRVPDANAREMILHRYFKADRVSPRREFFRIEELDRLQLLFELMGGTWWSADDEAVSSVMETPQGKKAGEVVITQFLNEFIFPPKKDNNGVPAPVSRTDVASLFTDWKRTNGMFYGSVADLYMKLEEAYGKPDRRGWTGFSLRE
jgi:hypothetical protein